MSSGSTGEWRWQKAKEGGKVGIKVGNKERKVAK
jgi:hypothetical protein